MDRKTIATYDALAHEYDAETENFWQEFPRTFLDRFSNESGKRIVNIGSGPARDGVLLREAGKDVICLDASQAMIDISTAAGFDSVLGDFNDLPFPDASFDGAWAYTSLLHVPKAEVTLALAEIRRVLRADGALALGLIEGTGEEYRNTMGGMPRWFAYYGETEIADMLVRNGLTIEYTDTIQPGKRRYLHTLAKRVS